MIGGTTTGGQGGQTVTVTNLTDFKNAAGSSSPLIIYVNGSFTGTGMINVASNKTIIGMNGATFNGVGLLLYSVKNIIIKNLKINKVVGGDCITIKQASHHIWIDQNEFWQDRTHGWDYYDGLLDITNMSDLVTVSNNKFHDTNIALLIGSGDTQTTDIGHLRVTLYGNYFYNVSERQPRIRFGKVHVFNNYMLNGSGYAVGAAMDAVVRTDNNYFENQSVPFYTNFSGSKPGFISGASTNYYKNCGANQITTSASSWIPEYEYKSVLIPALDVAAKVLANSGPKY
jgi:pectate lyase